MNTPLIDTLIALAGQDEVLVIHRAFVRFTGSLEAALLLNQLLYWTPKSRLAIDDKPGWIARSDQEWAEELMLTQYAVRQARATLEKLGVVETVIRKFGGVPKVHYRLILPAVQQQWGDFVNSPSGLCENAESTRPDLVNSPSPLRENAETCIETYIETTQIETTHRDAAAAAAQPSVAAPLFEVDPDQTTAFNGPYDTVFQAALKAEAHAAGRRGPQKWGSLAQKQQFREAAAKIAATGPDELVRAITEGLKRERTSRDSLVAWLVAWAANLDKPKSPTPPKATGKLPAGPSYTREHARQFYGH